VFHVAVAAAAVAAFLAIAWLGEGSRPSGAAALAATPVVQPPPGGILAHLLVALFAILAAAQVLGALARRIGQPPVVGEIVAGIVLGPSLLGALSPEGAAFVVAPDVTPVLAVVAQLGVILFMFVVGLELDAGQLRQRARTAIAVSLQGIAVPFVLGAGLALWLYPAMGTPAVPFTVFALFMGAAMSVTAFPVLARILADEGLTSTTPGMIALSAAAANDVMAWCLLALTIGVAAGEANGTLLSIGLTVTYAAAMVLFVRPIVVRVARRAEESGPSPALIGGILAAMLLSALATEAIGIHPIFGAFLFGALLPHDSRVAVEIGRCIQTIVATLLLPVFFVYSGLRTRVGLIESAGDWLFLAAIVAVAFAGKFGGTFVASRRHGLGLRDAASIGILMNTRGLVELVVLNVGLDVGVITPALFTMMVIMALATTFATTPILRLLGQGRRTS
jgi:Kef-type K+ transport system membrane component KefB